eukprot:1589366-Amphidinium_carterae.2
MEILSAQVCTPLINTVFSFWNCTLVIWDIIVTLSRRWQSTWMLSNINRSRVIMVLELRTGCFISNSKLALVIIRFTSLAPDAFESACAKDPNAGRKEQQTVWQMVRARQGRPPSWSATS